MNYSKIVLNSILGVLGFIVIVFIVAICYRHYNVWSMEMQGKARLAEASQSKQILIEQAKAELEAAKERAKAIEVMGEAAKKYPEYRMQEFIGAFGQALDNGNINTIIYVPTEANIPILESKRLNTEK